MNLKIIGFLLKVLKLAYDTFVEKPPARVRPMRLPRQMERLWMFALGVLGLWGIVIFIRWFFRPMGLLPGKTGSAPELLPQKVKSGLPQQAALPIEKKVVESRPANPPDDLSLLSGIGQRTAQVLASSGITTYQKIAKMTPEELSAILKQGGIRIANPANWPEQAAFAANDDWPGLKKYLASLKNSQN